MSYKNIFGLWLSLILLAADVESKVNGVLGESAIFQVKNSSPFDSISWTKFVSTKSEIIAVVTFGKPCGVLVPDPAYKKRVNISEDCRDLHLSHLKKEDEGRFTAGIVPSSAERVYESFDLQIFQRLLQSQLRMNCIPDGTGNGMWKLNCSTETWEDGVRFSWTSHAQSRDPTSESSVLITQDLNLNVTCTAENPVSNASKTVSLKQFCAEERPGTEAPQVNSHTKNVYRLPLWALLCLSKVGSLLLLGCLGLILVVKSRKASGAERQGPIPGGLPEELITVTSSQGQSP